MEIDINEKFLETFGSGTLSGALYTKYPDAVFPGKKVKLIFHTSSLSYCQNNGGPRSFVMSDFVPMCLVQDILRLMRIGVEIEIEEKKED